MTLCEVAAREAAQTLLISVAPTPASIPCGTR